MGEISSDRLFSDGKRYPAVKPLRSNRRRSLTHSTSNGARSVSRRFHAARRPKFELLEQRLALALVVDIGPASVLEGSVLAATVSRTGSTASPLTVSLTSSDAGQATVPASVVIPAGSASIGFSLTAVDEAVLDAPATVTITATAPALADAIDVIQVLNNDVYPLPAGTAHDVINLNPGAALGPFDVTLGPRLAPSLPTASHADIATRGGFQTFGESQTYQLNQFVPVDLTKAYGLTAWARSGDEFGESYLPNNRQSFGYAAYDVDYKLILPEHVLRFGGAADTTLAAPLNPGDTVIRLTNTAGWSNAAGAAAGTRGIAWYGYQNSHGYTYADYTYTRNIALGGSDGLWNAGAISGNAIALAAPWGGPALPAGAAVRNTGVGSDVVYNVLDHQTVPGDWTWTQYAGVFGGQVFQNGNDSPTQFRPGTAYIKPAVLANQHGGAGNLITWRDVRLTEVPMGTTPAAFALPIVDLSTVTPGDQRAALPQSSGWAAALVRVNSSESYSLTAHALNFAEVDERPLGFLSFDVDKKLIHPLHVAKFGDATDTTLAAPLSPGDTSFLITNASGWSNDVSEAGRTRALAWYGYADSTGHVYDDYSYTRHVAYDYEYGLWDAGDIRFDPVWNAYRVTLRQPWSGPTLAAGAAVRNSMGGDAESQPAVPVTPPQSNSESTWADYVATIGGGIWQNGRPSETAFRPGTEFIQPTFPASLWSDIVIAPTEDSIYGTPADSNARVAAVDPDRRVSLDLDVLAKVALGAGNPPVVIEVVSPSTFGTAAVVPGIGPGGRAVVHYESPAWYVGSDSLTYTLRNTVTGTTSTATVAINLLGGNFQQDPAVVAALASQAAAPNTHAPALFGYDSDAYDVIAGQTFLANKLSGPGILATVVDGTDVTVVRLLAAPAHGALSIRSDGSFTYDPAPGYLGYDSFEVDVFDGVNATKRTVLLNVRTLDGLAISRLKEIGLGMLNYESARARFPLTSSTSTESYFDASGNPYLSWRVHILPYLGYEQLYDQFHLNEPWNSAHNLPLASQMPNIFRDPQATPGGNATRFQIVSGEGDLYYWRRLNGKLVGPRTSNFTDGTGNTLLVVEVGADQAGIWTRPDALDFDPNSPLSALGTIPREGVNAVMADGSTITLLPTTDAATFKSLVTLTGGETVDARALRRQFAESRGAAALQSWSESVVSDYMRGIAFAMLNHESARGSYPVGRTDAQGMPMLSWRVHLLPYLGYTSLYNRFNHFEPWDSPTNLPLLAEMPDIFRSAGDPVGTTSTRFVTFFNNGATFRSYPGQPNSNVRGFTEASIRDGVANTVMFFEAGAEAAEPWTKPGGVTLVKNDPLSTAGSFPTRELKVAMFDGSLHTLPADVPAATVSALATQTGSEIVDVGEIVLKHSLRRSSFENESITSHHLHTIAFAFHDYESTRNYFPSNSFNAAGQPLLSWRVLILPYLGHQGLYNKFKLNEPWDSPNNLPLLAEMPDVYRMIGDAPDAVMTHIMTFTGAGALFPASGTNTTTGPRINNITDGTSNTFAFIEAGRDVAVPWSKPADLPYRPGNPFAPLGDLGPSFRAAFMDGSVHPKSTSMSSDQLNAYITPSGNDGSTPPPVVPSVPGFFVRQSGGNTATIEFGADAFDVLLDKAPLTNVVLSLAVSNGGIATLDRQTLTFTPANWNVPQRVVIRGIDNHAVNAHRTVDVTVAVVPSLSDDAYDAVLPQTFVATIRDDVAQFSADFATDGRINGNDLLAWQRGLGTTSGATAAKGDADNDGDVDRDDLTRWRAQIGLINIVADFNASTRIDGADFLAWQRGLGATAGATRVQGDADADGDVDAADLAGWRSQYGATLAEAVAAPSLEATSGSLSSAAVVASNEPDAARSLDAASLAGAANLLTAGRAVSRAKVATEHTRATEPSTVREHLFALHDFATSREDRSPRGNTERKGIARRSEADADALWTDLADDYLGREFVVPRRSAIAQ
jgi:hypothetical protein